MLKGDTDTDTDTLISEISIPIPILILFKYRISILIRYRYDTFGQKYRNFDTDTIVSKVSAMAQPPDLDFLIHTHVMAEQLITMLSVKKPPLHVLGVSKHTLQ